jgi:hypothetical protein
MCCCYFTESVRNDRPNIAFEADAVTRPQRFAVMSVAGAAQLKRLVKK